jgi:hypothetical protein
MKQEIYVIKDLVADAFLKPFFVPNENVAKRAVIDAFYDPEHDFTRYTNDYNLFYLGTYDNESGAIKSDNKFVCKLTTLKNEVSSDE